MQRLFFILTLFLFTQMVYAQEKKVKISLDERKENLLDLCHINGEGFLLKTGKNVINSKNVNWKLHRYSEDLNLLWELSLEKDQIEKGLPNHLVTSRYSNYVYHWEGQGYNAVVGTSKWFVTQIDGNQNKKTFERDNPADYIDAFFVNSAGVFVFANNGKSYEKVEYRLFRYDHEGMKRISEILKLPKQKSPKKDEKDLTNWYFVGQNGTHFFLGRKDAVYGSKKKDEKHRFYAEIAKVSLNGEVEETFELNSDLSGWKYVYPHMTFNPRGGDVVNHSEVWISTNANDPNQLLSQEAKFNDFAVGRIIYDELKNQFRIVGHYGDEEEKNRTDLQGVFIQNYDVAGKKLGEKLVNFNKLSEGKDKGMERTYSPGSRGLSYMNVPGKGHILELYTRKYAYSVAFDESLEVQSKKMVKAKGISWGNRLGVGSEFGKSGADYIQKTYDEKGMENGDYRVVTGKGEVLFLFDKDRNILELLLFKA